MHSQKIYVFGNDCGAKSLFYYHGAIKLDILNFCLLNIFTTYIKGANVIFRNLFLRKISVIS